MEKLKKTMKPYSQLPSHVGKPQSLRCDPSGQWPIANFVITSSHFFPRREISIVDLLLGFPSATMALSSSKSGLMQGAAQRRSIHAPRLSAPRAAAVETQAKTYSGKLVSPPKEGKHFLHIDDFSKEDILDMLDRAQEAKARLKVRDPTFKPFKDMSMAMIFTKPSARTRVSFETVRQRMVEG